MKNYKLTIELVPKSCWFSNVREVLSKKQWDILKTQVYAQAYYVCQICGKTGSKHPVECHEIWNYDDLKLIQKLSGMIALCPSCHMVKHIGLAEVQGKLLQAIKHLMKINKISETEAKNYIADSFKLWAERSSKSWSLDISSLASYGIDLTKIKQKGE